MNKPTILVLAAWYIPGYEKGGSVISISNIVNALQDRFDFKIITIGCNSEGVPYSGIQLNCWNPIGNTEVYYFSSFFRALLGMRSLISKVNYDILYLNSFFQPAFTGFPLLLRRLHLLDKKTVVLAPRGEFSEGALQLKRKKKSLYIDLAVRINLYNLYNGIVWQASSSLEADAIRRILPGVKNIVVAPDLANWRDPPESVTTPDRKKDKNHLRIIFLSRICRMKNLQGALEILKNARGIIDFDIFGPLEDKEYWDECEKVIRELPDNIQVHYRGEVKREDVQMTFSQYHLFLFPTLGENFGHVIIESLLSGCPVLISDQTPWHGLQEAGAGWVIPLADIRAFQQVIDYLCDLTQQEFVRLSDKATDYGKAYLQDDSVLEANFHLFKDLLSNGNEQVSLGKSRY
jgi:glycosyltransferase involved in cell wall biosynthesis